MINYGWMVIAIGVILFIIGAILFIIKLQKENLLDGDQSPSTKKAIAKRMADEPATASPLSFFMTITLLPSFHIIVVGIFMVLIYWMIDMF